MTAPLAALLEVTTGEACWCLDTRVRAVCCWGPAPIDLLWVWEGPVVLRAEEPLRCWCEMSYAYPEFLFAAAALEEALFIGLLSFINYKVAFI